MGRLKKHKSRNSTERREEKKRRVDKLRKMTESSIKLLEGEKAKEVRKVRDTEKSEK